MEMPLRTRRKPRPLTPWVVAALVVAGSFPAGANEPAWDESPSTIPISTQLGPEFWEPLPPPPEAQQGDGAAMDDDRIPVDPDAADLDDAEEVDAEPLAEDDEDDLDEPLLDKDGVIDLEAAEVEDRPWFKYFTPDRFEAGGTLTTGRRDIWTFLTVARWAHRSEWIKQQYELRGRYAQQEQLVSANEWIFTTTHDLKAKESPWLIFNKTLLEYDELERLSMRFSESLGLGYRFYDDDWRRLVARVGPTITYEHRYRPSTKDWDPEVLFEVEARFKLDRLTFEHKTSANTNVTDFGDMRLDSDTGLLIPLDSKSRWSTKLGFRYIHFGDTPIDIVNNEYTASFSLVYDR